MHTFLPFFRSLTALCLAVLFLSGSPQLVAQSPVPFGTYLEAECATVGENWDTATDSMASGNQFVVIKPGFRSVETPPEDIPANRVSFTTTVQENDNFHLWARVKAISEFTDSYWVRFNGGDWLEWKTRLRQEQDWNWREVIESPFAAVAGPVTIEFAFREPDTRLDKIYLSSLRAAPTMLGGPGTNCDESTSCEDFPDACANEFWYEAECGMISDEGWSYTVDPLASNSGYIQMVPPAALEAPTADRTSSILTFSPEITAAGDYAMFLRVNVTPPANNSFWIKVNGGEWLNYGTDTLNQTLKTTGFEWKRVNDAGVPLTFNLNSGANTIQIAGRETFAQLDKVYLGQATTAPTGFGRQQLNCTPNALTPVFSAPRLISGLEVFPNPVIDRLRVRLADPGAGSLMVRVSDATGRVLSSRTFDNPGGDFRTEVPVADLPAGVYQLTVTTVRGEATSTFVRR